MTFLISAVVQLIILAAIGVGIARMFRRRRTSDGTAALRRLFVYGLLAASVAIAASGVWGLIVRVLEPPTLASIGNTALARSLAFTIVGVPAAVALFRSTLRRLDEDPLESESAGWRLYVSAVTALSLLATMIASYVVVVAAIGLGEWSGEAFAWLVVAAAVWALHWLPVVRRHHPPTGVHLLLGTLLGFATVAGSAGIILAQSLERMYAALFGDALAASDYGDVIVRSLVALAIGVAAWVWHWFVPSRDRWSETMWHGWVLLGGVLSGVLTVLGAGGAVLVAMAIWFFGDTGGDAAGVFFEFVPSALAAVAVGAVSAPYHHRRHAAALAVRTEPARAYEYLLAAVGLAAALTGAATLFVAFFGALGGTAAAGDESSVNVLLGALVAFAMGVPLWARFWRSVEGHAVADPESELASPTRRSYLLAVLGIAGVTGLISVISVLFLLLEDLLEGALGAATLYDMRVPLALVLTAGAAAWYHWGIFRMDQSQRPDESRPKHVVLVQTGGGALAGELTTAGLVVDHWEIIGQELALGAGADALVAAINRVPGEDVLVVVRPDGEPMVVPYRTV